MTMETWLASLKAYLQAQTGHQVEIHNAKPLAGGASRDSWHLSVQVDDRSHEWVLRRDLPTQMFDESLTRAQEFALMNRAYQAGVRVAPMRYLCEDTSVLGSPFFLMDYVRGVSIGVKVAQAPEFASARALLPEQMAEQLALIHAMPHADLTFLPQARLGLSPAQETIAQCYDILNKLGIQNPVWEWTLRWAEQNAPREYVLSFVHGDFRLGNLLVDPQEGLTAVIDWEFGHVGDPDEELGYVCMRDWRFGNGTLRCAGLCERERFLQAYEGVSRRRVLRDNVTWWEIMGNIRWGIICLSQANRHLSGAEQSVELASLGRRSAEMQLETLRLIENT